MSLAVAVLAVFMARSSRPLLGLAVNVPVHGGAKEFIDAIVEERKLGCDMMVDSYKWSELEPAPGRFALDKMRSDLAGQVQAGFTPFVLIKTIDTTQRTLPQDLMREGWASASLLAREGAFLRALHSVLPSSIGGVVLGNEVDGYLGGHQDEVDGYAQFLTEGRRTLRSLRPDLKVGVTTMFTGLASSRDLLRRVQTSMDFVSMTYYPQSADFSVESPDRVKPDFDAMVRFAGERPLFIQEAGYPASPQLGSSEAKQAAFVDGLFSAMRTNSSRLLAVSYFLSVDFSDALVDGFVKYYGVGSDRFRAMLSTLGLKKQDGTPRMAWAAFCRNAEARIGRL